MKVSKLQLHEQSTKHISLKKVGLCKVAHISLKKVGLCKVAHISLKKVGLCKVAHISLKKVGLCKVAHISLKKVGLCKVAHCTGHVLANTRPYQLCWGDQEMETAFSCTKFSQVAGLIHMAGRNSSNVFIYTTPWDIWSACSIVSLIRKFLLFEHPPAPMCSERYCTVCASPGQ